MAFGLEEMVTGYPSATRTWAEMIKNEIIVIKARLTAIESQIGEVMKGVTPTGEVPTDKTPEDMESTRVHALSTIAVIAMARRAVYGYGMLLNEMGLTKDQKEALKRIEALISAALRLMQTLRMLQLMEAMAVPTPIGLFMAGGTLAASLMYGMKFGGG